MSRDAWITLVRRYADDRPLCNCREAYAMPDGMCEYGCSTNILRARDEIAERVLASESLPKRDGE